MFSATDDTVDGVPLLRLHGEIDVSEAPRLKAAVEALLARSERAAVLDLSGVTFFDSSGLKAVDEGRSTAAGRGVRLEIACPPGKVLRLLEITGVDDHLAVHPSVDAAVAALRG